jgi:glycosyltransferase involved in cell wall biosynthesis
MNVTLKSISELAGEKPRGGCAIAFFIRALEGGGASRDAILLANAVAAKGSPVTILTLRANGWLRTMVAPWVAVVEVGASKLRNAVPALAWTLYRVRPYLLVSAEAAPNLVALMSTRLLPKPWRPKLVLREVSSPTPALSLPVYRANYVGYRAAGFVYSHADLGLTLTAGARQDLIENFSVPPAKIKVMSRNAVLPPAAAKTLGRSHGSGERKREPGLIVSVGRLSPEKDQLTLVRAMSLLPTHSHAHLALAGDGPLRTEINELIAAHGLADRVTLLGHVEDPLPLLQRAEVAVCSSRYEGFGNAIVEALACGTSVVATDCPYGPREILQDGKYGRLVPIGDAAAMAAAIDSALADPGDREMLRARGLRFSADEAASEFLGLVEAL